MSREEGLAGLETLPTDVILHICSYLPDWRSVLVLLRASPILHRLYDQREVWSVLISNSLNAPDTPRIYYLDHPIYCYSGQELRQTFIRWKMASNVWKDKAIPRDWCNTSPALPVPTHGNPSVNRTIELPFTITGRVFLVPGGRWLVVLTDDVAAVYYDLDSSVDAATPEPSILFPSQPSLRNPGEPTQISMSLPDPVSHSPLKFRFAITFLSRTSGDGSPGCTLQIWEVTTVLDANDGDCDSPSRQSCLTAILLASVSFPLFLSGTFVSVKALTGDNVVVDIPELRQDPATTCISVIDWTTCTHGEDRFRRRVILFSDTVHGAMLVGKHNLLLTSRKGIFVYDFRRTKVVRTFSPKIMDSPVDPDHNMLCAFIANGEFHFVSTPVTLHTANGFFTSQNVACCNSAGEMYLVSISPRSPQSSHPEARRNSHFAGDLWKDHVETCYLGNSPARKAFKKTLAAETTMCLGVHQGVILEQRNRKWGGTYMQMGIVCYERGELDRLARSANDDSQDSSLGGGIYGDYVIGQVISRDVPFNFGGRLGPSRLGDNRDSASPVGLFFDESIARVVLAIDGRLHVADL